MKFQSITNIVVVVALAVNSFVLFRLASELQDAKRKLERADQLITKSLLYAQTAEEIARGLKGLDDMSAKELKAKARDKLDGVLNNVLPGK